MPALIYGLIAALTQVVGSLVGRILVALGIQYVTYSGFDLILSQIVDQAISFDGIPGAIAHYIGFFRITEVVSIITGAITARFTINGLRNGAITSMMVK